ncbi:undecaprenyl/decaprenyl-phosphate alpha-N-acetylglucosaminyl 1-phosphate transferase [bacterium]|nr:undecaprenyl/decaprenyl-phosphate alpha-N-acetylglucosaminyl 1-phosphate transferase [bacterium]
MSKFYALFSTPQGEVKPALYAVLFVFALLSTWLLTKLVLAFALKKKLFGPVGGRHVGGRQIPRLGGVALIVSFALTAVLAAFLHPGVAKEFLQPQTLAIFAGLLIVGALGVVDDLLQLNWATKFVFQIVASCLVIGNGVIVAKITNPFGPTLDFYPWMAVAFTLIWLVGITNAINLSDGLDGLCGGIIFIVAVVIFTNSQMLTRARPEQFTLFIFPSVVCAIILGAVLGFLRYNFYPAKIFLGDGGALFLGFLVACMAIRSSQISATSVALLVPLIALGLPILDTTLAFLRRTARRGNPFQSDAQHIHHKIMYSGLTHPETVLVLYGFCLLLGLAALALSLRSNQYAGIILVVLTIIILLGFKKFGVLDVTRLWGVRRRGETEDKEEK